MGTMVEMLEHPAIRRQVEPISVETYHALVQLGVLQKNVELLHGIIVRKMSKTPLHAAICNRLLKLLQAACEPQFEVRKEDPLTLLDSEPEPDIAVVPVSPNGYTEEHPAGALLVIEVAISSVETDREKTAIYAAASIPECWLVLPEEQRIEVLTEPSATGYRQVRSIAQGETLASFILPELILETARLFQSGR